MSPSIGVVIFPGSNCEQDAVETIRGLGAEAHFLWHGSSEIGDIDGVIIPGGFAHGDYLRPGAIARFSPAMESIVDFAKKGGGRCQF